MVAARKIVPDVGPAKAALPKQHEASYLTFSAILRLWRGRLANNLKLDSGKHWRTLEYYEGILVLTTSRTDSMDMALQSRTHVSLTYSHLNLVARVSE
jgi:hypothetical protein